MSYYFANSLLRLGSLSLSYWKVTLMCLISSIIYCFYILAPCLEKDRRWAVNGFKFTSAAELDLIIF